MSTFWPNRRPWSPTDPVLFDEFFGSSKQCHRLARRGRAPRRLQITRRDNKRLVESKLRRRRMIAGTPTTTHASKIFLYERFRVASYCRRVDLECDKHGIGGGSKHCDDNDAQPLSIVSECWRVWRVPSTKAFAFSTIVAGCWRGA